MPDEKVATVTREQVEADIRASKFRCRGPNLHTVAERMAFKKRWDAATPEQHIKILEDVVASLHAKPGVRKKTVSELHQAALGGPDFDKRLTEAKPEEKPQLLAEREARVRTLAFNMIHGHADSIEQAMCGEDVGELIIKDGKFDGEDHVVMCPKCGTAHRYSKFANIAEAK